MPTGQIQDDLAAGLPNISLMLLDVKMTRLDAYDTSSANAEYKSKSPCH